MRRISGGSGSGDSALEAKHFLGRLLPPAYMRPQRRLWEQAGELGWLELLLGRLPPRSLADMVKSR